jgi:hypothetical protein
MSGRRFVRIAVGVGLATTGIELFLPTPAFADNCSGLSDCSLGVKVGLVLAAILLAIVLWEVIAAYAAESAVEMAAIDAFELEFSETAAGHAATRPFMESRLLIQEIMEAAEPVPIRRAR